MFDLFIFVSRLMNLATVPRVPVKTMSGRIIQRPASKERACLVVDIFLVVIVPILTLYSLIQTNVFKLKVKYNGYGLSETKQIK